MRDSRGEWMDVLLRGGGGPFARPSPA
jgi:hypothetical protein